MNGIQRAGILLLLVMGLFSLTGCGKGKAVPNESEAKNAVESHITKFANFSPELIASPVKVTGIDSFMLLEAYGDKSDFAELAETMDSKVDLAYLEEVKEHYQGSSAIVKTSYVLKFSNGRGTMGNRRGGDDAEHVQWFFMRKPKQGAWEVAFPLTDGSRE